jgi:hypothetical protein
MSVSVLSTYYLLSVPSYPLRTTNQFRFGKIRGISGPREQADMVNSGLKFTTSPYITAHESCTITDVFQYDVRLSFTGRYISESTVVAQGGAVVG